jgi:triosephosphate isomerase
MSRIARPKRLIAGNWKMNGLREDGLALVASLRAKAEEAGANLGCEVLVCPPATLLESVATVLRSSPIAVGAQDCHPADKGAYTGDVSAPMLADAGAKYVIVGHSERRGGHGESDTLVLEKASAAHRAGLTAIVCIGETEAERDRGETLDVVRRQLAASVPTTASAANTVIAYEPVWAIGTGRTPTPAEIASVHAAIRQRISERLADSSSVRLLYGGSVKGSNAAELLGVDHVDGALVGGASLQADEFWAIVRSCR